MDRVWNFLQKNNSTEDGIDGTNGYFRRNSDIPRNRKSRNSVPNLSAEEKITQNSVPWNKNRSKLHIILFRTFLQKITQLGILFRGTKIDANSRNSVPNHSTEENTTGNSFPCNKNRNKLSECPSQPFRGRNQHHFVNLFCCHFVKLFFFCGIPFRSVLFRASELALPRNSECLGMSAFFRGITKTVPSLFR